MRGKWRIVATLVATSGLVLAAAPAQAGKTVKKNVSIGDYFFAPKKVTVKENTVVLWHWPKAGGDSHDVYLKKGPKGVKHFHSDIFSADASYKQKLKVPGTYSVICTLHPDVMKLTIVVKK
jgi:plastocyanin